MVSVCRLLQHICGAGLKPALPFSLVKLSGRFRIDTFEWTSKSAKSTKLKPKAKRSTGLIRSWNLCWRCSCTLGTIFPCTLYRTPFPLTVLRLTVLCQVGFSSYRCVLVRRVFERLHKRILRWIDVQAKAAWHSSPSRLHVQKSMFRIYRQTSWQRRAFHYHFLETSFTARTRAGRFFVVHLLRKRSLRLPFN